jgi:prepilin-type N-terminal cleavage/methylation domain-containing protein
MRRLREDEAGFTLIELTIVLVIIGVLLSIAVPSYVGFKRRAEQRVTASGVRAAIPAVEAWYSDHGTYAGMTAALLKASYDAGINHQKLTVSDEDDDSYTLTFDSNGAVAGGCTAVYNGPGGAAITNGGDCV